VNEDGLAETLQGLDPKKVASMIVDVSKEAQVKRAVDYCLEKFNSLTCMFANAGIAGDFAPFWDYSEDNIDDVFRINVYGVFYCFKHAVIAMQRLGVKDGSLIATASVAGIRSGAGGAAYSASKAAVINMGKTVANELTGTGIRCNVICPGVIETGMTAPLFALADKRNTRNKVGQLNPLLRYAVPKEIATVVTFLASPGASYITGQAIAVDGGLSSSHPVAFRKPGRPSM